MLVLFFFLFRVPHQHSCPSYRCGSHQVAAREGPGLSQVALPVLVISDFHGELLKCCPWAGVFKKGWCTLAFIFIAVLGQTGADSKTDMTWPLKIVSLSFPGSICCCTFHKPCSNS